MKTRHISVSIVRPADTTAYAAGDVVASDAGGMLEFEGLGVFDTSGALVGSVAAVSSQNASTKLDAELFLFRSKFTIAADNAAFAPTDAQLKDLIGVVSLPTASWKTGASGSGADGNAFYVASGLSVPVPSTVYGVLVARNAYAPVSEEEITITLSAVANQNS